MEPHDSASIICEALRAGVLNECAAKQANVVAILERVSRHLSMKGNMPDQHRFKEMQDELEYKKVQVQNAAMTSERLRQEREMRQQVGTLTSLIVNWRTPHSRLGAHSLVVHCALTPPVIRQTATWRYDLTEVHRLSRSVTKQRSGDMVT